MNADTPVSHAILALSDGRVFRGCSKGYGNSGDYSVGEVVFNTSMSGYQEILTDPSYHSQIINFTHPHIGNTGINDNDNESDGILAKGLVARHIGSHYSNWRATRSLPDFLRAHKVAAIDQVDTRALTRHLRDNGALGGCIYITGDEKPSEQHAAQAIDHAKVFDDKGGLTGARLADVAGCKEANDWREGAWQREGDVYLPAGAPKRHVVVLDCGNKRNILRHLTQRHCRVTVLPYGTSLHAIKTLAADGVLFSNGPGDPEPCEQARQLAAEILACGIPLFGLCLGHQIIASALGAKTEKMKFGHHGANHPVRAMDGRVLITSQNHGFTVDANTLPDGCQAAHRSLFDGSLQGLYSAKPPLITFQGHPEASPGPHDAAVLFDDFMRLMDNA